MTPPARQPPATVPTRSLLAGEGGGGGTLPSWAPWGAFVGALVFCAAVEAALGWFTIALMLVFGALVAIVAIYAWSRAVEGTRRAKDRAITMAIASAFGIAMAPLISLLYEVVKRGVKGHQLGILHLRRARRGQRRRRRARDRRHPDHHRLRRR